MFSFLVTLRSGRKYTIRASKMQFSYDGGLELLASPPPTDSEPFPAMQVIAVFAGGEVESVVAKEFLISEEKCDPAPHVARGIDPIPF